MHSYGSNPTHSPLCPALLPRAAPLLYEKPAGWLAQLHSQTSHGSGKLAAAPRAGTRAQQKFSVHTSCLGRERGGRGSTPRQNPRLQTAPKEMWRQQDAAQTPRTGSPPAACTTAKYPTPSLTPSTALSLVHPGLWSQGPIMSPAQTETHPLSSTDSSWRRTGLGNAPPKKEGTCQRL